ncbi:MAG: restriction endonuclease subunit S [Candidatus Omnitrophica bacterium]|nr:restriction endonuclease subunit S [Candidatus Omnitrophota bacterium]
MKQYSTCKNSGIEWIGRIPQSWNFKRLKYLDRTIMGQSPESDDCNRDEAGVPFLQGNADFSSLNPIPNVWCKHPNKLAEKNDILLSVRAPVGAVNIADQTYGIGRGLCAIRPKRSNKKYSYYRVLCLSDELNRISTGSTYSAVSVEQVNNVVVPDPAFEEQEALSAFLDRKTIQIDDLIAKKERMIELLKEERIAIINQAVTKGLDPNVEMKESGIEWLGRIPKHWDVKRLKYLSKKIGSGVTPKGGASVYQFDGVLFLRSQNIHFDGLRLDDVAYISQEVHDNMIGSKVFAGDVLLNITGASIGRCYYYPENLGEANVNQHVCIIRPNKFALTKYLTYCLSSELGQQQIINNQNGISREGLNFEELSTFVLPMPDYNEQKKITKFIDNKISLVAEQIKSEQKSIELLKEYRSALVSEVVTGKIDIRETVKC